MAYSTEEHRIGTWIDGKPLYRKIIETVLDWVSSTGYTQKTIQLNTPGINAIANVNFIMYREGRDAFVLPFINTNGAQTYIYSIDIANGVVTITNGVANWSGYTLNIMLEYTKITD